MTTTIPWAARLRAVVDSHRSRAGRRSHRQVSIPAPAGDDAGPRPASRCREQTVLARRSLGEVSSPTGRCLPDSAPANSWPRIVWPYGRPASRARVVALETYRARRAAPHMESPDKHWLRPARCRIASPEGCGPRAPAAPRDRALRGETPPARLPASRQPNPSRPAGRTLVAPWI